MQTVELSEDAITMVWASSETVKEVKRRLRKRGFRIPTEDLLIWADWMRTDLGVPLKSMPLF